MPEITFIVDVMLGKLSRWLRILGYDTEYCRRGESEGLVQQAVAENRQLLTRNTRLIKRAELKNRLCFIKDNDPLLQLREVLSHYQLTIQPLSALTRCLICNTRLIKISSKLIASRVPEYVLHSEKSFLACPLCGKIYWRGSHYRNMQERIKEKLFDP